LEDLQLHIKQLNTKLQQLLKQYAALAHENVQQKKTLEALAAKTESQKEEMEVLKQQHLILKASLDQMEPQEKKELEQKISGYIRNIDKCISLLSYNQNA
jgi:chromosome segregation ATPase